jgi:hypothetical protein
LAGVLAAQRGCRRWWRVCRRWWRVCRRWWRVCRGPAPESPAAGGPRWPQAAEAAHWPSAHAARARVRAPGAWITVSGRAAGQSGRWVRGKTRANHDTASRPRPGSRGSTSCGGGGGLGCESRRVQQSNGFGGFRVLGLWLWDLVSWGCCRLIRARTRAPGIESKRPRPSPRASSRGHRPPPPPPACFGVPGGNSAQRLWPASSAFQALVARGSMCSPLPLRAGPMTTHLRGKRRMGGREGLGKRAVREARLGEGFWGKAAQKGAVFARQQRPPRLPRTLLLRRRRQRRRATEAASQRRSPPVGRPPALPREAEKVLRKERRHGVVAAHRRAAARLVRKGAVENVERRVVLRDARGGCGVVGWGFGEDWGGRGDGTDLGGPRRQGPQA